MHRKEEIHKQWVRLQFPFQLLRRYEYSYMHLFEFLPVHANHVFILHRVLFSYLLLLHLMFKYIFTLQEKKGCEDSDDEDEEPTTVPRTTYKNQHKHIAAVHKAVGYASRAKTHAGRSNAMTKCTRMGVEAANGDKLARKDRDSASKSYGLDVPADAVVALTGWMGTVRDYECPWYIPPSSWPPGLEDALLDLAIPYYRSQKAAVDTAHRQYTSHQQLTDRCLVTARASLESLRHNVVSALLAAASRPVSRKLELHKNAQPMCSTLYFAVVCSSRSNTRC